MESVDNKMAFKPGQITIHFSTSVLKVFISENEFYRGGSLCSCKILCHFN